MDKNMPTLAVNTIRMLAADAVEKAASGHPGMPMGCADFAYVLWTKVLRHNPSDPAWPGRDRFVLSAGHGSALLYAMLHLSGYEISLDDIKNFRQWDSPTPGHPEYDLARGVETTTGPLGQGFAMGVGMAMASKMLAAEFGDDLFDSTIYSIAGDGCIMEGVSHEAASLAGHLGLGNLVYFYDSNRITIEGSTDLAFSDDTARRFESYNWHVVEIDGHDHAAIQKALLDGKAEKERPTLIIGRTHIAFGSPGKQDSEASHGAPLGEAELKATRENLGWPVDSPFLVPVEVREIFMDRKKELAEQYDEWKKNLKTRKKDSAFADKWKTYFNGTLPDGFADAVMQAAPSGDVPTRKASGEILQKLAELIPGLVGGSADLGPSNNTVLKNSASLARGEWGGRNVHFGVREFAMAAVANGMFLHGGVRPYAGTFLQFADYMRPAIRLSSLMCLGVPYVFTHDSIFLGEDGPTHQPIEHIASLRAMPNMTVIRPADATETAAAWVVAMEKTKCPTALMLTRQKVRNLGLDPAETLENVRRGAYVLRDASGGKPEMILIATGSEVALAVEAWEHFEKKGLPTRVVSMPSFDLFELQKKSYRDSVLPPECARRVSIEAASTFGWDRYVKCEGLSIGIDRFGASAPAEVLAEKFGFTADAVIAEIETRWG